MAAYHFVLALILALALALAHGHGHGHGHHGLQHMHDHSKRLAIPTFGNATASTAGSSVSIVASTSSSSSSSSSSSFPAVNTAAGAIKASGFEVPTTLAVSVSALAVGGEEASILVTPTVAPAGNILSASTTISPAIVASIQIKKAGDEGEDATSEVNGETQFASTSTSAVTDTSTSASVSPTASEGPINIAHPSTPPDRSYRAVVVAAVVILSAIGIALYAWYAYRKKERRAREKKEAQRLADILQRNRAPAADNESGGVFEGRADQGDDDFNFDNNFRLTNLNNKINSNSNSNNNNRNRDDRNDRDRLLPSEIIDFIRIGDCDAPGAMRDAGMKYPRSTLVAEDGRIMTMERKAGTERVR